MQGRYFARQPEKFLQSEDILQNLADFEAKRKLPRFGNQAMRSAAVREAQLSHLPLPSYHCWAMEVTQDQIMIALV